MAGKTLKSLAMTALLGCLLSGCASSKQDPGPPKTEDLLELLTGFGEAISQRNFDKAASFLTQQEQMQIRGPDGSIPELMQKRLAALPLQRLIKNPAVKVENGRLAGIYSSLPLLRQGEEMDPEAIMVDFEEDPPMEEAAVSGLDPRLKEMVTEFYSALNKKAYQQALLMVHEDERKIFVDASGKVTEDSKRRLARVSESDREALVLREGKLTGLTLIVPDE